MAPATLTRRRRKPRTNAAIDPAELLEEDLSAAFYMPAFMTLDEFRTWTYSDDFPETGRIAYLGKEIFVDMSAERINSHGSVKVEVCTVLGNLVRKRRTGKFFMDGTRLVNVAAEVSNEPDAFFATWETLRTARLRRIPTKSGDDDIELEGTPDWIMEIVSPSSVTKDTKKLRNRYHKAGIGEYWLINARGDEVDFQILILGKEDYEPAESVREWQVSTVFGKKFRLRRIKDELGDVDYRLDVK